MAGGSGRYPDTGGAPVVLTATVAGSAKSSLTVSGLDGNADGDYDIYFNASSGTSGGTIGQPKPEINGSDSNLYSAWIQVVGASTVTGARTTSTCGIGPANSGASAGVKGWIRMRSRTISGGNAVSRSGTFSVVNDTGPTIVSGSFEYLDQTTNITSLTIVGGTNSLDVGSFMTVRKLFNPS